MSEELTEEQEKILHSTIKDKGFEWKTYDAAGNWMSADIDKDAFDALPQDIKDKLEILEFKKVWEFAADVGFIKSRSEARRLAKQGGLYLNNKKVTEDQVMSFDDLLGEKHKACLLGRGKRIRQFVFFSLDE